MKKKETILAEMTEKKSKYGNLYFEGKGDSGAKFIMQKSKNARGEKVWKLFIAK
tara:strand:+ start:2728 stop:2889 length:162 start_codon:yes stop_codon:yes gene_type:complete